jgi:hypothetical protein
MMPGGTAGPPRRRPHRAEAVRVSFVGHEATIGSVAMERVRGLGPRSRELRVNGWDKAHEDMRRMVVSETAVSTYLDGRTYPFAGEGTDGGVDVWIPDRERPAFRVGVKSSSYAANRSHLYVAEWDKIAADAYVLVPVRGYEALLLGWAPRAALRGAPLVRLSPNGPLNRVVPCTRDGCRICGGGGTPLFAMGDLREIARRAVAKLDEEER